MTTAGTLVTRVAQELLGGTVEERNKLASPLTSTGTTVTFLYSVGSIRANSVFEIGSELLYAWTVNTSAKTAEVERAYGGTTATAHDTGAPVNVSPRFPRRQILTALNHELIDLSSPMNGLFQMKTVDIAYNGSDRMVDMTGVTNIFDVYDVRYRYLNDDYPIVRNVRFLSNMPTADFPSGNVLAFDEGVRSGTVRVLYKAPYTTFTSEASTIVSSGAPAEIDDLLVLGSQIRMIAGREIKRNFTESQGDTRRPDEVPPGAVVNSVIGLQRLRRDRILAESARLARLYPTRIRK